MNITTELKKTDHEGYYRIIINGVDLGIWEKSQIRQLVGDLDVLIHH